MQENINHKEEKNNKNNSDNRIRRQDIKSYYNYTWSSQEGRKKLLETRES